MRRLLILAAILGFPLSVFAATPTQIQHRACPSGANSTTCGGGGVQCAYATYVCPLPEATLAGNIVIVTGQIATSASTTIAITDDLSDTFTIAKRTSLDSNQTQIIAYAFTTTGARVITVTFGVANATFTQWDAAEYNNIQGLDGSCASNNSTTGANPNTVTAGNMTPTQTGDLIVQIATPESGAAVTSYTVGTTVQNPNTAWNFRHYDIGYGSGQVAQQAVQNTVYPSVGTINPTMMIGTINIAWGSAACLFKANSSGSADPGGGRITTYEHVNIQSVSSNTVVVGFPANGNTGFLACTTAPGSGPITSVVGSVTGTWNHLGDVPDNNGSGIQMLFTKVNTTLSLADVLTLTTTTNLNVADCVGIGMENMLAAPIDTAVTAGSGTTCNVIAAGLCSATGDDATTGNVTMVSLTPSTSTGIVIMTGGVNRPQTTGCVSPNLSDTAFSPEEGPQQEMDENNPKCHQKYSSASLITFVVTKGQTASTLGLGGWASTAVAFKSAPIGPTLNGGIGGRGGIGGQGGVSK